MSLTDFIQKKRTEIAEQGIPYAVKTGFEEGVLKALNPIANHVATPIWDSDADIILVLDACRVDLWTDVAKDHLPTAEHATKWSVGSASSEWIGNTFAQKYKHHWKNSGYVTANAFSGKQPDSSGYRKETVYPLRMLDIGYLDEVWVDDWNTDSIETVTPQTVTERGLYAWNNRNELGIDRLVVHYMQPHVPFRSHPEWSDGWANKTVFGTESDPAKKSEWHKLRDGEIDESIFWNAYADNLEYVLTEVNKWVKMTDATILITSDHGNAMGEYGMWGHPPGNGNPAIRKVPWVIVNGTDTSSIDYTITGEPPTHASNTHEHDIERKLHALGYKE